VRVLLIALAAMFFHQILLSTSQVIPAVLAPLIIVDLGVSPAMAGFYFGLTACFALVGQMGCGSFILRYGPLRMSQIALLSMAVGMAIAVQGSPLAFILLAVIGATGAACATPASSQLLNRLSPPRQAPIVFSVKQTAVPIGMLLGGSLAPTVAGRLGWQGTMLAAAAILFAFVFVLQPLRPRFDADRLPSRAFRLGDLATTLRAVMTTPSLRGLAYACFAFNGMQSVMSGYFVIYMTQLGYDLVTAGYIFSVAVAIAIPCRVLWSWLGSFHLSARLMMAWLALGMAAAALAMAFFTQAWPIVGIEAAAWVLSATALSWHGILLSETARLAPEGMVGSATGGVLSFGQAGSLVCPLVYGGLLHWTGSYGLGFAVCGIPALFVGINLLWRGKRP
jgi:predicted MFS family arabinose efflux permease